MASQFSWYQLTVWLNVSNRWFFKFAFPVLMIPFTYWINNRDQDSASVENIFSRRRIFIDDSFWKNSVVTMSSEPYICWIWVESTENTASKVQYELKSSFYSLHWILNSDSFWIIDVSFSFNQLPTQKWRFHVLRNNIRQPTNFHKRFIVGVTTSLSPSIQCLESGGTQT